MKKTPKHIVVYDRSTAEMTIEEIGNMTVAEGEERWVNAEAIRLFFILVKQYLDEHNLTWGDVPIRDVIAEKVLHDFEEKALNEARALVRKHKAKARARFDAQDAAWLQDHPGRPLPENRLSWDEAQTAEYAAWQNPAKLG